MFKNTKAKSTDNPPAAKDDAHSFAEIESRIAAARAHADRTIPSLREALNDDKITVMALESRKREIAAWRAGMTTALGALNSTREDIVRQTIAGAYDLQTATEFLRKLETLKSDSALHAELIDALASALEEKLAKQAAEEDLARRKKLYAAAEDARQALVLAFDEQGAALKSAAHALLRAWVEAQLANERANNALPPGRVVFRANPELFRWGQRMQRTVKEEVVKYWVDEKDCELARVGEVKAKLGADGSATITAPDGRSVKAREVDYVELTITQTSAAGDAIPFPETLVIPALRVGERPIWPAGISPYANTVRHALEEAESPPPPFAVPPPTIEKRLVRRSAYEARIGRKVAPPASGGDGQ